MAKLTRRNVLRTGVALAIPPGMLALIGGCDQSGTEPTQQADSNAMTEPETKTKTEIKQHHDTAAQRSKDRVTDNATKYGS